MDFPFLSRASKPIYKSDSSSSSGVNWVSDASSEEGAFSDATLKLINQMLMEEEDLEDQPYHVLDLNPSPDDHSPDNESSGSPSSVNYFVKPNWVRDQEKLERSSSHFGATFEPASQSVGSSKGSGDGSVDTLVNQSQPFWLLSGGNTKVAELVSNKKFLNYGLEMKEKSSKVVAQEEKNRRDHSPNGSREKKTHHRGNGDNADDGRTNKQLASYTDDSDEQLKMFDIVFLSSDMHQGSGLCLHHDDSDSAKKLQQSGPSEGSNGGKGRGRKQGNKKEMVDLQNLLTQCSQAVARADIRSVNEQLNRIRQHSSAQGDGIERLAHYFANALEARLAGTGTALYVPSSTMRISAADVLKSYQTYVKACPFNKMSNLYANRSIMKLAQTATTLHIIHFGILYGFQWACLIHHLSARPGGPPKLHITGIDFPQPGFHPAERVEQTGRRLETYCKRFNVQFEYTAIAKKWETIEPDELKIDRDEVLVVNCLFRLGNVPDETVLVNNPRDIVLNLVQRIKPDMFIHGVVNGMYNAPFFVARFREALFHFSSIFNMFEATIPREDGDRVMLEKEIYGRDIMNVIACEGPGRVERPESYKQWQIRTLRAGFKQLPLNQDLVKLVRSLVKVHYHKDFVVDKDGNWMLQGWKGRILYALSCWKPIED
ncbi:Scarecrow-like protein 14 [Camellia lanceoleosa]|uniref:Scarecrow-like protein 14 n=1 Tax=Camellia lanceoleosa TaxID=1840588 RepID=A0ACC0HQ52_9ERIC|nr:Scarecrow-like protein 14 [Camellia lanceoleosa]